jgi:hypothetical protein
MMCVAGCATFPPEDGRVGEINKSAGSYADQAILLNVIRAERYEPLSFVTVTGLDGTNSLQGSLGFGGFTLGPHPVTVMRDFLLGPDSISRTGSNTFHVSVVDDPASYVALMSPVTPATTAFFINQGYPRELLFFLMVDHLRKTTPGPDGGPAKVEVFRNDPSQPEEFGKFIGEMSTMLARGLTAEIDVTSVPSGRAMPKSALCFDASLPPPAFLNEAAGRPPADEPCKDAKWIEADQSSSAVSGGAAGSGAQSGKGGSPTPGGDASSASPPLISASDGSLWVWLSDGNKVRHLTPGKPPEDFVIPAPKAPTPPKPSAPLTSFPLNAAGGVTYEVYTRSVFGIYAYLGALGRGNGDRRTDIDNLLPKDGSNYGGILNIIERGTTCFTQISYEDRNYCVPSDANNTKFVFNLLHQLQELNTAPSNAPTTLTVTTIP